MECLINGYVPTELMIGGQVINGCAKGGEVVYRKKNAGYITNYGDDFITTNDTVYAQIKNLNIYGKTQQDQYYIETVEDSVVQFDDGVGEYATVEVKANENLLLGTKDFSEFTSSDYVYVDTDGFSVFETPNGSTTYNFNNVKLNYGQNYVLSFYIKGTTTTSQNRELIQWFDESGTRISYSWITYAVSEEFEFTNKIITPYSEEACYLKVGLRSSVGINSYKKLKLEEITDINPDGTPTPWIPNVDDGVDMPSFEVTRCGKNLQKSSVLLTNQGAGWCDAYGFKDGDGNSKTETSIYLKSGTVINIKIEDSVNLGAIQLRQVLVDGQLQQIVTLSKTDNTSITIANDGYYTIKSYINNAADTFFGNIMMNIGSALPYEPYNGTTYTLTANTPTQIPLLDGINTFFADTGDNLTVRYLTETETEETTPNADFPQEMTSVEGDLVVKSAGKNIVMLSNMEIADGFNVSENPIGTFLVSRNISSPYIKYNKLYTNITLKPNTTYTLSGCPQGGSVYTYALIIYNNGLAWGIQEFGSGRTFTSPDDQRDDWYISVRVGINYTFDDLVFTPQLELGSTATDYEPYTGSAATLTLTESLKGIETSTNYNYIDSDGQTWLNDILDVQNSEIKKNLAEIVFDGTENWEATSDSFIRMHYTLGAKPAINNNTIQPLLCNLYNNKTANQTYLGEEGVSIDNSGNLRIYSADFTDVISWKAYLAGLYANNTPLRIIYQLNTPTTEQIDTTSLKKLRSYVGQTNLFVDNNAGVQADFRVNYGELITITDNLIQFDNGFTGSYISVTADEDCEVTRCGKNLLNINELLYTTNISNVVVSDNQIVFDYDRTYPRPYIDLPVFVGKYITANATIVNTNSEARNSIQLVATYSDGTNRTYALNSSTSPFPVEMTADMTNVRAQIIVNNSGTSMAGSVTITNWQVEIGGSNTDYEPYNGPTATLTLTAGETVKIPVLNGTNILFTNSATATLTANYYTYSDNTYAYSNALNELGVNSANTTDQMINQLEDMGVEI